MTLISLGFACRVRESIDRFNEFRVETNFFDWIMSNFSTVLYVFQNIDNPELFLTKNHFKGQAPSENNKTHYIANHNQLYFMSLHDFPVEIPFNDYMPTFLETYKRRLLRLKNLILNSTEKLHFIHMIGFEQAIPTIADIYYFVLAVQKINSNCKFYLHLLIPPEFHHKSTVITQLLICGNIKVHYLTSNPSIEPNGQQRHDLNWSETYKHIQYHF